jgi:hypothetical protein
MSEILRLLKELKGEMVKAIILHSFLDSAIIFLVLALFFTVLNINLIYLSGPMVLLFIILVLLKVRKDHLRYIERMHPEVNEMLRTAHDTRDSDSFMVRAFHLDVFKAVKAVDSASLLRMPKALQKVFLLVVLAVATVGLSASHFHLVDVGKYVNTGLAAIASFRPGDVISGGERIQDDAVADIGNAKQQVELTPLSYELDISTVSAPDLERVQQASTERFPVEAVQTESYEERIPADQREIVKNYFKLIR